MRLALAWSGGKDSALALQALRRDGVEPDALLTTVTEGYERISMHGVRRSLLVAQARAVGVPLLEVRIPQRCTNEVYDERMAAANADLDAVAFGDLFLEDVRAYREERLGRVGKKALFPLWGSDTAALARRFLADGFRATLCCVDPRRLDGSFAGRAFDPDELPAGVDPCGENDEFHTFVHAGPIFDAAVPIEVGEPVERDGFAFCDLR
ncbi:MAG TPA: hypothetical protein VFL66_10855 [Gaiellaceae bacterium]|nr:hypothetical protein [Gaiellaceae bacterium]